VRLICRWVSLGAVVALFAGACAPAASPTPSPVWHAASGIVSPSATASTSIAGVSPPLAPTSFTATMQDVWVACPAGVGSTLPPQAPVTGTSICRQIYLQWLAGTDPGVGVRVYEASLGDDREATCLPLASSAVRKIDARSTDRVAMILDPSDSQVPSCYWIASTNEAGESEWVAAASNVVVAPPSYFLATLRSRSSTCPPQVKATHCSVTDLTWESRAGADTWFRIYATTPAADGIEGGRLVLETAPGARTAQLFAPTTSGDRPELWITAVSALGESAPELDDRQKPGGTHSGG
jgi:hypothetical protein